MSFVICCTKKLLDRINPAATTPDGVSDRLLGNWYATALFWRPQVALLVNEKFLLPVLMFLVPATNLATRFPEYLAGVLAAHGRPQQFIGHKHAQKNEAQYAKTSNRSLVGIMSQFSYLAEGYREHLETSDLLELSRNLADTTCSPLHESHISPNHAVAALAKMST